LHTGSRKLRVQRALWFSKPAGMSYPTLKERFAARGLDEALWIRQMTLGPTPEFCFQTSGSLPVGFTAKASLDVEATWEFS
jgi:hypothetical protein